jgi:hypothetical protein
VSATVRPVVRFLTTSGAGPENVGGTLGKDSVRFRKKDVSERLPASPARPHGGVPRLTCCLKAEGDFLLSVLTVQKKLGCYRTCGWLPGEVFGEDEGCHRHSFPLPFFSHSALTPLRPTTVPLDLKVFYFYCFLGVLCSFFVPGPQQAPYSRSFLRTAGGVGCSNLELLRCSLRLFLVLLGAFSRRALWLNK